MVLALSLVAQNKLPDEAVNYLRQAADDNAALLLVAAQIERRVGKVQEARSFLERYLAEPSISDSDRKFVRSYLARLDTTAGAMALDPRVTRTRCSTFSWASMSSLWRAGGKISCHGFCTSQL